MPNALRRSTLLTALLFGLAACSDTPAPVLPDVQLAPSGAFSVPVSAPLGVRLDGVTFVLETAAGKRYGPADFRLRTISPAVGGILVAYSDGPAGGPERLELLVTPRPSEGYVVVEPKVTAPAGAPLSLVSISLRAPAGGVTLPGLGERLLWLNHGYQSWAFTGVLGLKAPFKNPVLSAKDAAARATALRAGLGDPSWETAGVSWWLGLAAPSPSGVKLLAGASSAERWRTVVLPELPGSGRLGLSLLSGTAGEALAVAPGKSLELERLVFAAGKDFAAATAPYVREVGREMAPLRAESVTDPTGWWSWNIFFDEVTEKDLLEHAALLARDYAGHGYGLVELDDGYELLWGDWLSPDPKAFPSGHAGLVKQLKQKGLAAGLWLAPFLVDERSTIVKTHPEYFVKKADGTPLTHTQLGIPGTNRVLDPTHPGAKEHLQTVFETLATAGYSFFKLDFLYAGALPGKRHVAGTSGTEALRLGLQIMRESAGGAHVNLCGMPVLPAIGRGHSLRTGTDIVFVNFKPSFVFIAHEARNVLLRSFLDPLIRSDPDQALLRAPLSADEARAAATLTALTGFHSSGDDLTKLSADRQAMLKNNDLLTIAGLARSAQVLDPFAQSGDLVLQTPIVDTGLAMNDPATVVPQKYLLEDKKSGAAYLALFNWSQSEQKTALDLKTLGAGYPAKPVKDLWQQKTLTPAGTVVTVTTPPHGVTLLKIGE